MFGGGARARGQHRWLATPLAWGGGGAPPRAGAPAGLPPPPPPLDMQTMQIAEQLLGLEGQLGVDYDQVRGFTRRASDGSWGARGAALLQPAAAPGPPDPPLCSLTPHADPSQAPRLPRLELCLAPGHGLLAPLHSLPGGGG